MNAPRDAEGTPRFALFMLILIGLGLAIVVPQREWGLYAIVVGALAYLGWRFHGYLIAGGALVVAFVHLQVHANLPEQMITSCVLLTHVGTLMAWSVAQRRGRWWWGMPVALLGGAFILQCWLQTKNPSDLQIRLMQSNACLLLVAGLGGIAFLGRTIGGWQALILGSVLVGAPLVTLAGLYYSGYFAPELLSLSAWTGRGSAWSAWANEAVTQSEPWCWATAWVIVPLMGLGLWRAWTRGRKQRRAGLAPLGWLFGLGALSACLATLPDDILLLHVQAIVLPFFGLADLSLALVERIQLEPPT